MPINTLQLLSTLSTTELSKFLRFLQSPYFNNLDVFPKLLEALLQYHPKYSKLNKPELFKSILPDGEEISTQYINERLSQLNKLTKQFLQQEELKKNLLLRQQLELAAAHHRNEPKWFLKSYHNAQKLLSSQHPTHWENTLQLWSNYNRLHNFPQASASDDTSEEVYHLHYLDEYYILQKLRYVCNQKATRQFYQADNPKPHLLEEIKVLASTHFADHPIITLYYQLLILFDAWSDKLFSQTMTLFYDTYQKLETSDQFFLLVNLINHAMNRVNSGHTEFIATVFQLYHFAVEDRLFLNKFPLTETTFLNICTYGAFCNEEDWTKRFIKSHQHLLPVQTRAQAKQLGTALFLFHSGQFEAASKELNEIKASNYSYKLRIRSLSARCLLELHLQNGNTYKTLVSMISTNKLFLYRNKDLSRKVKQGYLNMNTAILKIADLHMESRNKAQVKEELILWLHSLERITAKAWLLNKINTIT